MKIYQLEIKNFRGIKDSTFKFTTPLVCLIGLEYVLSPNWFIPIDDGDFTNCNTSDSIEITATIGPVPAELMIDSKFYDHLRGWNVVSSQINDEPDKDGKDTYVISIRLTIDDTLAPEWKVITERDHEGKTISYRDRQKCAISRIGETINNELSWMRGSSLLNMSKDKKEVEKSLLTINRQMRELGLPSDTFASLFDSITRAKKIGKAYGIKTDNLRPNIDPQYLRGNVGTVSLHDGEVPFRRMGLGTRRLMAIGLQLANIEDEGAILLIDEIEQALEPHRLKHLLRTLFKKKDEEKFGQIFITTQSPSVLEELGAEGLYCVHYNGEKQESNAQLVQEKTQGSIRRIPEAFLSPKVIVCEGPTEMGLLRAFEKHEIIRNGDAYSFAYLKTVIVNGEGSSSAPERTYHLSLNKYTACLFIDSDELSKWKVKEEELRKEGVKVVRWDNEHNTEMQLCHDLPMDCFEDFFKLAVEINGNEDSIVSCINNELPIHITNIAQYDKKNVHNEESFRISIGISACKKGWFKTFEKAEALGDYLFHNSYDQINETGFYKKFKSIQKWAIDGQ
jgi:putative ATP-dependent endonuclease of OLD family